MQSTLKALLGMDGLRRHFGNREARRRRTHRYLTDIASKHDLYIYKSNLIWFRDDDFVEAKQKGIEGIPDDRCFTLLEIARKSRKVDGDIAECGVRRGKSAVFMLKGMGSESEKSLFLFDSFEGLSSPTNADDTPGKASRWKEGNLATPIEAVRENLRGYRNVRLMKGWIPERFEEIESRRFSLVHIDVDLHRPTLDSLEFFYPRMAKGGYIVCDDYGFEDCPGAKRAFDDFFRDKPEVVLLIPTGQCIVSF